MIWFASLLVLAGVLQTTAAPDASQQEDSCRKYPYCEGTKFEERMYIKERTIHCDTVPSPKKKCCLPTSKHFVCYNIMVSGGFLSIDKNRSFMSTNFEQLCDDILAKQGHPPGNHTAVSVVGGETATVYQNHAWKELEDRGSERIQHLACGVSAKSGPNDVPED